MIENNLEIERTPVEKIEDSAIPFAESGKTIFAKDENVSNETLKDVINNNAQALIEEILISGSRNSAIRAEIDSIKDNVEDLEDRVEVEEDKSDELFSDKENQDDKLVDHENRITIIEGGISVETPLGIPYTIRIEVIGSELTEYQFSPPIVIEEDFWFIDIFKNGMAMVAQDDGLTEWDYTIDYDNNKIIFDYPVQIGNIVSIDLLKSTATALGIAKLKRTIQYLSPIDGIKTEFSLLNYANILDDINVYSNGMKLLRNVKNVPNDYFIDYDNQLIIFNKAPEEFSKVNIITLASVSDLPEQDPTYATKQELEAEVILREDEDIALNNRITTEEGTRETEIIRVDEDILNINNTLTQAKEYKKIRCHCEETTSNSVSWVKVPIIQDFGIPMISNGEYVIPTEAIVGYDFHLNFDINLLATQSGNVRIFNVTSGTTLGFFKPFDSDISFNINAIFDIVIPLTPLNENGFKVRPGDVLRIEVNQTTGGSLTISPTSSGWFSIKALESYPGILE